jgi:hypothetical protein
MEYDGWGLNIPATLYIEMIQSSQFKQLTSSVRTLWESKLRPEVTQQLKPKKRKESTDNLEIVESATLEQVQLPSTSIEDLSELDQTEVNNAF